MLNEEAAAGPIAFFAICILTLGLVFTILSPVMDAFIDEGNSQVDSATIPATQERMDALNGIANYWSAGPALAIIGLLLYLWAGALEDRGGTV